MKVSLISCLQSDNNTSQTQRGQTKKISSRKDTEIDRKARIFLKPRQQDCYNSPFTIFLLLFKS